MPKDPGFQIPIDRSIPVVTHNQTGRYQRLNGKSARWYGSGQHVSVQGYNIADGLIYVGETLPDSQGYENDACLVNPKLKVLSAEPWEAGEQMGYWPKYAHIPEKCRGAYLKWLAGGRTEPETYIGYVFLFFYGLERRLFVDGLKDGIPENERAEIVKEVIRLLKIYGGNHSFRGYASNFLAMEWVLYHRDEPVPDYLDFNDRSCSEPFQVILAQHVVSENPIPANVALQWVMLHPDVQLRTPARRCVKEFRELFAYRYHQRFGEGLKVKPNKTPLKLSYHAASPSVRSDLTLKLPALPNPFILTGPLKKLQPLVEECVIELDPYSRFMGRKNNDPNSISALALLPKELLHQTEGAGKAKTFLARTVAEDPSLTALETLYDNLSQNPPTQFGKKEAENLVTLVERLGYGIAPDVRFHNIKPNLNGNVVVFPQGHGPNFQPSPEFQTVGLIARLGAMVAQVDQDQSPAEEAALQNSIRNNPQLTETERRSLLAFLHWCLKTPQDITGLKQGLTEVSPAEKTAIGHILISVAHADRRIDPKEIKQLERLYASLGLDKEQVTSDIHTLVALNGPVTVGLRDPETSFAIPKAITKVEAAQGFRLDEKLIQIREEETRQVKGVLERIFSDQTEDEAEITDTLVVVGPTAGPLDNLDKTHQNLLQLLLEQETWERAAFHKICKELNLMVDGAMEVINEWAFDNANAPLIEDGEPIYIDLDLAKEIVNA